MTHTPHVVYTRAELREALAQLSGTRGLVMTMGALHEGHLSLVKHAHERCDHVIITVFVNPTQFAPGEDFDAYPRTLDADVKALGKVRADVIFAPSEEEMYPHGDARVTIDPGPTAQVLEGATRPTHFAGVCLVVNKVLNMVHPDVAVFGQKDAQQLAIIRQMVRDLDMGIEIVGAPIVRDVDGLALSSRNAYLSDVERTQALVLSRALEAGRVAASNGARAADILARTQAVMSSEPAAELDYVALVDPITFSPIKRGPGVLAIAAKIGTTRLIDNTLLEVSDD